MRRSRRSRSPRREAPRFLGYRRADGRVGTRNEIWILPTVGCVARTAQKIAAVAGARHAKGAVDGVHAFAHPFGCSQLGEDLAGTPRPCSPRWPAIPMPAACCSSASAANPTSSTAAGIAEAICAARPHAWRAGRSGTRSRKGCASSTPWSPTRGADRAEPVPASASWCSASNAAARTASRASPPIPLVGRMADARAGAGGSAILTEIPEIFGAERLLMARARRRARVRSTRRPGQRLQALLPRQRRAGLARTRRRAIIAGGITTLEEKSLGAVQKAGHALVERRASLRRARPPARPQPARGAGQRRRLLDRARGRGRDPDPVHHRPRHAARLPGADGEDRVEQRARRAQARLDRLRRRPGAARRHRARRRRARRRIARSPRARRPRPSATASARSRSGSAASPCDRAADRSHRHRPFRPRRFPPRAPGRLYRPAARARPALGIAAVSLRSPARSRR